MFSRRKFFSSFGATIAAVALAQKVVGKAFVEKFTELPISEWVINPAYTNAPYEVSFIMSNYAVLPIVSKVGAKLSLEQELHKGQWPIKLDKSGKPVDAIIEASSLRYQKDSSTGKFKRV